MKESEKRIGRFQNRIKVFLCEADRKDLAKVGDPWTKFLGGGTAGCDDESEDDNCTAHEVVGKAFLTSLQQVPNLERLDLQIHTRQRRATTRDSLGFAVRAKSISTNPQQASGSYIVIVIVASPLSFTPGFTLNFSFTLTLPVSLSP